MMAELSQALARCDADDEVGSIVITRSEQAFAAGADIMEMQSRTFIDCYLGRFLAKWDSVVEQRKPIIAAVAGFALGGGCELAMMCDFIIAGAGGTQRLARAVGKAKAMDHILTGRMMDATGPERSGLVARVVPADKLMEEALAAARRIASYSRIAAMAAKEAVNRAAETTLAEGERFERRMFESLFDHGPEGGHGRLHRQAQTTILSPPGSGSV